MSLPALTPSMDFAEASAAVLEFLEETVPMGSWSVTRYDGERQVHLAVRDGAYGLVAGDSVRWDDSFCKHVVAGAAPSVAADAMAVPQFAAARVTGMPIGSYVGIPINRAGGKVYGTLCGLDPERKEPSWEEHKPMLELLSLLLQSILESDLARTAQRRELERAVLEADTDALTGLLNRRGWNRYLELEDDRHRRFGDPALLVVVDLDNLKAVNDARGHAAGDELIERAGRTIGSLVRSADIVARLGGDEFGVVVTGATPAQADAFVRRLDRGLRGEGIAASIGAAPYTFARGFPGAWDEADRAMYAAKSARLQLAS